MGRAIPDVIKQAARDLRQNMTESEKILWEQVKNKKLGLRIIRQTPISVFTEDYGRDRYIIADFYCPEKKLIIEIDGSIHDKEEIYKLDRVKEELLEQGGYNILRFTNSEVTQNKNFILTKILQY